MKFYLVIILIVLAILFPKTICMGTLNGLRLWSTQLVPSLLITLVMSGILIKLMHLKKLFIIQRIDLISIICILSGLPNAAYIYSSVRLTKKERRYLSEIIGFINISSPGFVFNYIYNNCLNSEVNIIIFVFLCYFPSFIMIIINRCIYFSKEEAYFNNSCGNVLLIDFCHIINESVEKAVRSILSIGVYVCIFSCLVCFISVFAINNNLYGIITGFFEISNGIYIISGSMVPSYIKMIIMLIINSFAGICTLFQTMIFIKDKIIIKKYIYQKIELTLITAILGFLIYVFMNV